MGYRLLRRFRAAEWGPRFPRFAPDVVVEFRSPDDRLSRLRPERRVVEIYRTGVEPETLVGAESVAGEGPVDGFVLDLRPVWNPDPEAVASHF
jgi:hypothetical protein